ncbi:MAG TPA: 1,4-alpha-glucan branching enzyme, partial [Acidimicrobiales bacterium]
MTAPVPGDLDQHLFHEGRHHRLWEVLGAHRATVDGVAGTAFAVWAPTAEAVSVVGDFNAWTSPGEPLAPAGSSGIWTGFVASMAPGDAYKFRITTAAGAVVDRADPLARRTELPPATASVVDELGHSWADEQWVAGRGDHDPLAAPMSIYEVHLGSWRHGPDGQELSYGEIAEQL